MANEQQPKRPAEDNTFQPLRFTIAPGVPWPGLNAKLSEWFEGTDSKRRILSMEGIRGIAILMVFLVHYHALFMGYIDESPASWFVSRFLGIVGNAGVDLFFVLSGYLIYGAAIKRPVSLGTFMKKRVERIYPTFLVVFGMYLLLSFFLPSESRIPRGLNAVWYVLANIALLPGMTRVRPMITVAWSLSYELFYYLALPTLVALTGMRAWRRRTRVAFFGGLLVLFAATWLAGGWLAQHGRLSMFVAGIVVYEVLRTDLLQKHATRGGEKIVALAAGSSMVLMYLLQVHHHAVSWLPFVSEQSGSYQVIALFVGFLGFITFCIGFNGRLARLFAWTPIRWMGNISYSYYLIHGLTLKALAMVSTRVLHPNGHQPWFFWPMLVVCFFATLASSAVLFLNVERPMMQRLTEGLPPVAAPSDAR